MVRHCRAQAARYRSRRRAAGASALIPNARGQARVPLERGATSSHAGPGARFATPKNPARGAPDSAPPPDIPPPPAYGRDRRGSCRGRGCIRGRGSRAPCRSHGNDRCKAAWPALCRCRRRFPAAPGWPGSPARSVRNDAHGAYPGNPGQSPICGAGAHSRRACGRPGVRAEPPRATIDTAGLACMSFHPAFRPPSRARSPAGPSMRFAGQRHRVTEQAWRRAARRTRDAGGSAVDSARVSSARAGRRRRCRMTSRRSDPAASR